MACSVAPVGEGTHAVFHLVGGLVGERDRQDLKRRYPSFLNEMGNAVREHAGLARSGSGDDQQRTTLMQHGIFLRLVQAVDQLSSHRPHPIEPAFCSNAITGSNCELPRHQHLGK